MAKMSGKIRRKYNRHTHSITRTINKRSIKILNHLKEDEVNRSDDLEIPVLI